jgi:hypothetical protein
MTVVDFDDRTITFVSDGNEVTLTWGELNFLKHYKADKAKETPAKRRSRY